MYRNFILIKNIRVQNANALSSPYTIGFPAMTAWLGFVHALQRYIYQKALPEVSFKSIAVTCHEIHLHTIKNRYNYHIINSKNPPSTRIDEKFLNKNKSFIPEPRCNMECSLLIEHNISNNNWSRLYGLINQKLHLMKIAGGDIVGFQEMNESLCFLIDENEEQEIRRLTRQMMPGYLIIERRDLMVQSMSEGRDALEALLDHLKIINFCDKDEHGNISWKKTRKGHGWLVPIATGFHGITELKQIKGQRDPDTPHRFAEAVITLGEFIMPYRAKSLDEILWYYHIDEKNNLYLCQQKPINN